MEQDDEALNIEGWEESSVDSLPKGELYEPGMATETLEQRIAELQDALDILETFLVNPTLDGYNNPAIRTLIELQAENKISEELKEALATIARAQFDGTTTLDVIPADIQVVLDHESLILEHLKAHPEV